MQDLHHHGSVQLGDGLVQHVGRVLLVGLNADVHLVHAEALGQQGRALDDLLGTLQTGAVVAGDVRLALSGVDDHVVHLAQTGADLHMGGERCAALADDAGVLDDLHQLLRRQAVGVRHGLDFLRHFVLEVVFDDHGHHLAAHVEGAGLHSLDRTGYGGVDGCGNKSAGFADPLSNFYLVAHRNDRLARCTDVHRHGNDHLSRRCQLFDGLFIGRGLHVIGMNAAKESLCHCLSPHLNYRVALCHRILFRYYNKSFRLSSPPAHFSRFFWRFCRRHRPYVRQKYPYLSNFTAFAHGRGTCVFPGAVIEYCRAGGEMPIYPVQKGGRHHAA